MDLEQTLFDKYGGFSTVSRIVLRLYDQILDDDDLGPFFDDVDMSKMVDHQTKFVSSLLGGPASFTDKHLKMAHAHMVIEHAHMDRLKEVVESTLNEFDVDPDDVTAVVDAFEARRSLLIED